jgi:DNA-binding Lrp family transcriptional regulator
MITGVVLIKVERLKEKFAYDEIKNIKEVKDIHNLLGLFDIYIKIECKNHEELSKIVIGKIRSIDGVLETKTLPAVQYEVM